MCCGRRTPKGNNKWLSEYHTDHVGTSQHAEPSCRPGPAAKVDNDKNSKEREDQQRIGQPEAKRRREQNSAQRRSSITCSTRDKLCVFTGSGSFVFGETQVQKQNIASGKDGLISRLDE